MNKTVARWPTNIANYNAAVIIAVANSMATEIVRYCSEFGHNNKVKFIIYPMSLCLNNINDSQVSATKR